MPRSIEDLIAAQDEADANYFEHHFDGSEGRKDAAPLRAVAAAAAKVSQANRELVDAVTEARHQDCPWIAIGVMVGTTGEAARQRFGKLVSAQ